MVQDKFRKLIAVEWVMLWLIGFFWAAAMFLPLFLTGSFDRKEDFYQNLLIMFGPYLIYLCGRLIFMLYQSVVMAYLTSNLFFRNSRDKILADQWFRFVVFVPVWSLIMAYPMYLGGFFGKGISWGEVFAVIFSPYAAYGVCRLIFALLRSFSWAVKEATTK